MVLHCDDYGCKNNMSGFCHKETVSVEMKFGEFQGGNRKCYHSCQSYEGRDGDDD